MGFPSLWKGGRGKGGELFNPNKSINKEKSPPELFGTCLYFFPSFPIWAVYSILGELLSVTCVPVPGRRVAASPAEISRNVIILQLHPSPRVTLCFLFPTPVGRVFFFFIDPSTRFLFDIVVQVINKDTISLRDAVIGQAVSDPRWYFYTILSSACSGSQAVTNLSARWGNPIFGMVTRSLLCTVNTAQGQRCKQRPHACEPF
jgi:hypothetical protein